MAMKVIDWLLSREHVQSSSETGHQQRACQDVYLSAVDLQRDVQGVIHVAGTKGKGSTCTAVESILRSCGYKTTLFTSPHVLDFRERIRINGALIEQQMLDDVVQRCYSKLKAVKSPSVPFPGFFHFMTLAVLMVYREMKTDALILEVGIGGRFDPTNLVRQPWACGITSIGMDHMDLLGNTLNQIAWEKGGIIKPGAICYTVEQYPEAYQILNECAEEAQTKVIQTNAADYTNWNAIDDRKQPRLYMLQNTALAVSLAKEYEKQHAINRHQTSAFLRRMDTLAQGRLPEEYIHGIENAHCYGCAQILCQPFLPVNKLQTRSMQNVRFYLDGAHTVESLEAAVEWLQSEWQSRNGEHVDFLLFNCHSLKTPHTLLQSLHTNLQQYRLTPLHTFFAPQWSNRASLLPHPQLSKPFAWQEQQMESWATLQRTQASLESAAKLPSLSSFVHDTSDIKQRYPNVQADVFRTLPSALRWFGEVAASLPNLQIRVFVTGSIYFVSDILKLAKEYESGHVTSVAHD